MNNPRSGRLLPPEKTALPGWPRQKQHVPLQATNGGQGAATSASADTLVKDEALFLASLPVIDAITGQVCRRHRLSGAEAEDFRSEVRLHFIERNYEVLRRFQGRSSLPTYVNVVIQRVYLDYRNRQWGKWRPSAEAKRFGPTAILLERLVSRDGWSFEQAVEMLRVNYGVTVDETLRGLYDKLMKREPARQLVSEEEAGNLASSALGPDVNVLRAEQGFLAKRVRAALDRARQALEPEERLILTMRFEDAVAVADIARALHVNQKRLYRTIERLLARIGANLEAEGIARSDVSALFADGVLSWNQNHEAAITADVGPRTGSTERKRTSWLLKR
jgi:RNA polymerase sigma factor (sigma-70 family)